MNERTLYHVTDATNKDSILDDGLRAGDLKGYVFLTETKEEADFLGDVYDTIDDPVVFKVQVSDHRLEPDPEDAGDIDSWACHGDIRPQNLEVVSE